MQKYKRNRKETKIDIELLLTNPTKKDHKNKIINPIFQVFLLTFPYFYINKILQRNMIKPRYMEIIQIIIVLYYTNYHPTSSKR